MTPPAPAWNGLDLWTELHYAGYRDDNGGNGQKGYFGVRYLGGDYPVTPDLLIGLITQFDWSREHSDSLSSSVKGQGWMAGPYVSARLQTHLFFDARAAWGTSKNSIDPFGSYTDDFDTTRWLVTARLTGNWVMGHWRITPSAAVKYGQEHQKSYTDSLGVFIPGQTVKLGRFAFGPEIAYRIREPNGAIVEPELGIKGLWDFENDGTYVLDGTVITPHDFRAELDGGVQVELPNGWSFALSGDYDGIGLADYHAYGGKLRIGKAMN